MPGCIHFLAGSASYRSRLVAVRAGARVAAGAGACVNRAASGQEGAWWGGSARIVIPRRVAVYEDDHRGRKGRTCPAACRRMVPVSDRPRAHSNVRPRQ